jgi:hypothetical protein
MGTREDLKEFPCFVYQNGQFIEHTPEWWDANKMQLHHFIRRQQYKRNPDKYKNIQKLLLIPTQMHLDCHAYHSRFFDKWGIELKEVIYTRY